MTACVSGTLGVFAKTDDLIRANVLLVNDDADEVELTVHSLAQTGVDRSTVVVACSTQETRAYLQQCAGEAGSNVGRMPRLILIDYKLSSGSSVELLAYLRSMPATSHVPIVVLSGSAQQDEVSRCYELGANSFVERPVGSDDFRALIHVLARYWLDVSLLPQGTELERAARRNG